MESQKVRSEIEVEKIEPQNPQSETEIPRPASPCWKKKTADGGFLANFKDHLDEFVNTSMDQHRICLKKTIRGVGDHVRLKKSGSMFRSSKVVTESNLGAKEVDSASQVQSTTAQ